MWWDQVDKVLNIEEYLQNHFHADDRVREAEAALALAQIARERDMTDTAAAGRVQLLAAWRRTALQ